MNVFEHNESLLTGKGKIIFPHLENDTVFELEYMPYNIRLKIPFVRFGHFFSIGYGKFEGVLADGTIITCSKIGLSKVSKSEIAFVLLEKVLIGKQIKPSTFKTKIIGSYLGNAEFQFKEYSVKIEDKKNDEAVKKYCVNYGNILEGSELTISTEGDLESIDIFKFANDVCLLISLLNGNTVTFNRYELISKESESQEIWRIQLTNPSRGNQSIDLNDLSDVLNTILLKFQELKPDEKKCLETVIGYLNSTNGKYMEDSILNIAQAWEIFADQFNSETLIFPKEIEILKADIKKTIKNWKKVNSITYDTSLISNRLTSALTWDKVIRKIENLCNQENLNLKVIKLDTSVR